MSLASAQVAAIEHAADCDGAAAAPDFMPGTNAQRHTARIGSKHMHARLSKSSSLASSGREPNYAVPSRCMFFVRGVTRARS